nr:HWE histidine kinase domain-containing protein [Tropicimonas isoalkanivorans]
MAGRIRDFDWRSHPFGRLETWPQSLRSALGICLNSAFPTAIYWGPELRLLYNDAWSHIPGPRHPAALGAPARDVWSDIWHIIEPQFVHLIETGDGIFVEDQYLPMRRFGVPEETYWSYSFTPIRGEDGLIAGVFNSGSETTHSVLQQRHTAFVLSLNDALRTASDPQTAQSVALRMLAEHLGAIRAGIRERDFSGELVVAAEWNGPRVSPIGSSMRLSDLGVVFSQQIRAGHVVRINAVDEFPDAVARAFFRSKGTNAVVAAPWMKDGSTAAVLFVHTPEPRTWSDLDIETIEQVLERTMAWIERERVAAREKVMAREIDHRARNLLAVVGSIVRLTTASDSAALRLAISERIDALAETHSLLAKRRWEGATLRDLLAKELSPYGVDAQRCSLSGPKVVLKPLIAQALSMVFHELATNAAKYGALSAKEGRLDVRWEQGEESPLVISWEEHLPSHAAEPSDPERVGFGSVLLAKVVEDYLSGTLKGEKSPNGVAYMLTLPLGEAPVTGGTKADTPPPMPSDETSVLIVEDDVLIAMDLAELVRSLGYSVSAVTSSVEEGLEVLKRSVPDIALLDMFLDDETSKDLLAPLKAANVPIVVMSGHMADASEQSAFSEFPQLEKPFSAERLAHTLMKLAPLASGGDVRST